MAESSLWFHGYNTHNSREQAIYLLCQAKFMSETAEGLGKETLVLVHRSEESSFILQSGDIETIRKFWEEKGKPRIPAGAYDMTTEVVLRAEAREKEDTGLTNPKDTA